MKFRDILFIALLLLVGGIFWRLSPNNSRTGVQTEAVYYDVVGTQTASTTLISLASTSTLTQAIIPVDKLENLHLDLDYTPATTSAYMVVTIDGSRTCAAPWFPLSTKQNGFADIRVFSTSSLAGINGTPLLFPGGLTTVTGTQYTGTYDQNIMAGCVRITARENATSGFGKAYIGAVLSATN